MTLLTNTTESFVSEANPAQRHVIPFLGNAPVELRMAALKALANMNGLRLPDTRLPEGTALLPIGEESRRKMKVELAALPDLHPALLAYEARLRAEDPKDARVMLSQLRMSPKTGGLFSLDRSDETKPDANYTKDGFGHVASYMKPVAIRNGFPENMLALPNELRSQVFNHWAGNAPRSEPVVVRTFRGGTPGRIIRAVTSESHSLASGDDLVIVEALRKLAPGAKARFTREPGGRFSELEVIWPMMDRQLVVGDICYGGIRITNSETKAGSLKVEAFVLRVLCYNFTTAFSEDMEGVTVGIRHVGDLLRKLPAAIENASRRIEPFVRAFGDAYKDGLPEGMTRGEVLERAGKVFELSETTLSAAQQLWDADGSKSAGDTRAGFVHALTRASQEQAVSEAAMTERIAGKVIAQGWSALMD
jgi:hypothetical protein